MVLNKLNRSYMRLIYLYLLVLINIIYAQNSVIDGKITDMQSLPVMYASVFLEGTNLGTTADSMGCFKIEQVVPGDYLISVSYLGYLKDQQKIKIKANEKITINFKLHNDILSFSDIIIHDERSYTASSSFTLNAVDFKLRPKESAQDLLNLVPGLITAQHAGGGKAEQIFLRGFDADHGTDVNISVDGIPVNLVSHAHGQGYADLHFVMPETIEGISVQKGPYYAASGDFSTAGSIKFNTIDKTDKNILSVEGGSFGTTRIFSIMNIPFKIPSSSLYIAGEYARTDGYFDNKQDFNRYNFFGKFCTQLSDVSNLKFTASAFKSDWNASGQIPERALKEGIINRFGSIDNSEGGNTGRYNFNLQFKTQPADNSWLESQVYLFKYNFRLYSDFTFFLRDPVNGDEIEQDDDRITFGYRASYSFSKDFGNTKLISTAGTALRQDFTDVQLWNTKLRSRLSPNVIAGIHQKNYSLYLEEELLFGSFIRLQLALRGDHFVFDVNDKIAYENSEKKSQTILSPKANLVFSPSPDLNFFLNYGTGFHSNDARAVAIGSNQRTLPGATAAEFGSRISLFKSTYFSTAFWLLHLDNEFVYVGDEGVTELSGATRRIGIDLGLRTQLSSWLWFDSDLNLSRGRFKDQPDGANYIPLAPHLTYSGGFTLKLQNGFVGNFRCIHVSSRPADETNSVVAWGSTLFDMAFSYPVGIFNLGISIENIFNTEWNEAQFDTESKLKNETEPVSELHFTPGHPRMLKASLSLSF